MKEIYFDEAGNTGHDLLNKEQPIFVLSSTCINNEEAEKLLKGSFTDINNLHFKRKRKTTKGQNEILDFWEKNVTLLNETSKSMIIHKKFMIICQMLNYLVEPQLYEDGIDYYDEGMNINHSNMMFMCLPTLCGEGITNRLYKSFIEMVKIKSPQYIDNFYKLVNIAFEHSKSEDLKNDIYILQRSQKDIKDTLKVINKYVLDPSMHSLISLITSWNDELDEEFIVNHDRSNTINNQKPVLDFLNSIDGESQKIGYGDFKAVYPLKMKEFNFVKNDNYSIKLCDIVCSSLAYTSINNDAFSEKLKIILKDWKFTNNIMPSFNVNPIKERKKEVGDVDVLDFFTEKMSKSKHSF